MKKTVLFILTICFAMVAFAGCSKDEGDVMNQESTTSVAETQTTAIPIPEKTELTAEDFVEAIDNTEGYTFKTELNTKEADLALFPYEGLQACALVVHDDANVASFFVFDTEENAMKVLNESKSENAAGYGTESGKNFEMLKEGAVVIERVGATVLNISTDDEDMSKAILNTTDY